MSDLTHKDAIFHLDQFKKLIHSHFDTDDYTINTDSIDIAIKALSADGYIKIDEAIEIVHKTIYEFFDDPTTDRYKMLLSLSKAICNRIRGDNND